MAEAAEDAKTPFTIVTGFLGAGKTTLINYILTEQKEKRICVIENEFGEINIDEKLVGENLASKEDLIKMDNGCACCSIRGDLVRTLGSLVKKRKQFDSVLLETTGLADPAPIIATIKSNQWIDDNFEIDSVVCLADTKHVKQHLDEVKPDGAVNEAVQQVAFADRVLLNKVDLVTPEELDAIQTTILSINKFAVILTCERSRVDLSQIVGVNSFDVDKCTELDPELFEAGGNDDNGPEQKKIQNPRPLHGVLLRHLRRRLPRRPQVQPLYGRTPPDARRRPLPNEGRPLLRRPGKHEIRLPGRPRADQLRTRTDTLDRRRTPRIKDRLHRTQSRTQVPRRLHHRLPRQGQQKK
mmetsp:Transcript_21066/g.67881  ORF Transcript_21066/g.67881 Transcript_21066/m.67881 type:complete len:354 (+) Transcript_21066:122-1183(+)